MTKLVSREEFENWFLEVAHISKENFDNAGLIVVSCDCGEAYCMGWNVRMKRDLETENNNE